MEAITEVIGNIIIITGVIFMVFGVIGLYKLNTFYTRILATSKIDTVGVLTVIIGIALRYGIGSFTGKVLLLAIIMLIFNPLVSHILARSAYLSGQRAEFKEKLIKPDEFNEFEEGVK